MTKIKKCLISVSGVSDFNEIPFQMIYNKGEKMQTITYIKDITTILGFIVGAISLVFAALNSKRSSSTNRAKFWLELRTAFTSHNEVHLNLRPGGKWHDNSGPSNPSEYSQIESYMGLFEHCEIMLDQKLIDEPTFTEIYRYRLVNLVHNNWVKIEKLKNQSDGWVRFINLLNRMNIDYK